MRKQIYVLLTALFLSASAHAQTEGAAALERFVKILQNNPTYYKCILETKVESIKLGDATFGPPESTLVRIKLVAPEKPGKPSVQQFAVAEASARLSRTYVYNPETDTHDKNVLVETIDAIILHSYHSIMPNRILLEHRGDGKITSLRVLEASAYLDGKGPSYSENSLRECIE